MNNTIKIELKQWLKPILKDEGFIEFSIEIEGNSDRGDNYLGDIFFINVIGQLKDKSTKQLDLVAKCSKRSDALRESTPVHEIFTNEIYLYETVFPVFKQFQKKRNITDGFESYAKCYGSLILDNSEVIVFENLKKKNYELWDRTQPMPLNYLEKVIGDYAKFHAISIAMQDQEPENFNKLVQTLDNTYRKMMEASPFEETMEKSIIEVADMLEDLVDKETLKTWRNFKDKVKYIIYELPFEKDCKQIISHGDCWNNNFMFQVSSTNEIKVAILDWQMSKLGSGSLDLSYYIFACISEEDIKKIPEILKNYHTKVQVFLKNLGSDPNIFPYEDFKKEWQKFCIYGISIMPLIMKICLADKSEAPDIAEEAEKGNDMSKVFEFQLKDNVQYKYRLKYLIEYVVNNNLI